MKTNTTRARLAGLGACTLFTSCPIGWGKCIETMKTIKFSLPYVKLRMPIDYPLSNVAQTAKLLMVINSDFYDLTPDFIEYDTCSALGGYNLPKKGPCLILIFQKSIDGIFTTVRRHTNEKEEYYRRSIGEVFRVEIAENNTKPG